MDEVSSNYEKDPIYNLCFELAGMESSTAMKIFTIKQFLDYFGDLLEGVDGTNLNENLTNILMVGRSLGICAYFGG